MKKTLALALALAALLCLSSCFCIVGRNDVEKIGIWENATYLNDTTLGDGAKEIQVIISGEDQSITLTINTDKDNLGDALYELNLIDNPSFFVTVNGMTADYIANEAWWKVLDADDKATLGVNVTEISGGELFKIVYTIGF